MNQFNPKLKLKVASIFSGIGAFEEALHQMGVETDILFACDYDNAAYETYNLNWFQSQRFFSDVFTIRDSKQKYNLDILMLSPPCVEFSKINYKRDLGSQTAKLVYEPLKLIEEGIVNPKVILFENVDNLLTIDNGKSFKAMLEVMNSLNYNISYKVINANLFSATNRSRLFIVMTRKDIPEYEWDSLPQKIHPSTIKDHLENTSEKYLSINKSYTIKDSKVSKNGLKKVARFDNMIFNQGATIYDINHKSCCFTTRDPLRILVDNKVRKISIREQLSIMGFRDEFQMSEMSYSKGLEKVGNSIAINVLKFLLTPMFKSKLKVPKPTG